MVAAVTQLLSDAQLARPVSTAELDALLVEQPGLPKVPHPARRGKA
jgi:hypothetical protein